MPQHFSFLGYKQRKLTAGLLGPLPGLVGLNMSVICLLILYTQSETMNIFMLNVNVKQV